MIRRNPVAVFLLAAVALSLLLLATSVSEFRMPGVDRNYEPAQPIALSPPLHPPEH